MLLTIRNCTQLCMHEEGFPKVVPQKVLFKDEKYIQETIEILSQLIDDADLKGNPHAGMVHTT